MCRHRLMGSLALLPCAAEGRRKLVADLDGMRSLALLAVPGFRVVEPSPAGGSPCAVATASPTTR